MRWNCPHCSVPLAVADDKVGTSLTFSRCYKCGGFAMIKRSEINLIKVDRAPMGERVLLPEQHESPTAPGAMMSAQATQHLQQAMARPVIKPSARLNRRGQEAMPVPSEPVELTPSAAQEVARNILAQTNAFGLPDPLPKLSIPKSPRERLLPVAIALTGLLAIGSGIYLYLQGQALYLRASAPMVQNQQTQHGPAFSGRSVAKISDVSSIAVGQSAPQRAPAVEPSSIGNLATVMNVRATIPGATLYSEPSTKSKTIKTANPSIPYDILEWKDAWVKLRLPTATASSESAWIKSEWIRAVQP